MLEYCVYSFYNLYSTLDSKNFSAFDSFIKTARVGSRFSFSNRLQCEKDRENVYFFPIDFQNYKTEELYPGNSVNIGRNIIRMNSVSIEDFFVSGKKDEEFICGDSLRLPLMVRSWKKGDRFVPLGSGQHQKVSDFFINHKVPRFKKEQVPIVCDGENIVWIAGYRMDERFKVNKTCKSVYKLTLEKTDGRN
jgi:tRNA(Ile)-lysidine synthase